MEAMADILFTFFAITFSGLVAANAAVIVLRFRQEDRAENRLRRFLAPISSYLSLGGSQGAKSRTRHA